MDLFAPKHLLIILVIVLLVFGTKKLKTIGSDLGGAFRGFKKAMNEHETESEDPKQIPASTVSPAGKDAEFPDVAAKPRESAKPASQV
jgi:sec-independent protein translocase protein TatA